VDRASGACAGLEMRVHEGNRRISSRQRKDRLGTRLDKEVLKRAWTRRARSF
jgi:hypothetical protein